MILQLLENKEISNISGINSLQLVLSMDIFLKLPNDTW